MKFGVQSWPRGPVIGKKEQGEQAKTLAGFWSCFGQIFRSFGGWISWQGKLENLDHFSQARQRLVRGKRWRKPSSIWTKSEGACIKA
ncbi:hypothetical protein TIFTF001_035630 [Ficus carica]|uniref:Uncharacterized protein n=1 Tax=Ficus carica TaxID=3494 RepID=A0AA88J6P5_FICCA|nr:hypothetical protein TIFTF001_035630 [Ficus carica]